MGIISYTDYMNEISHDSGYSRGKSDSNKTSIGFFSLKNDKDSAIVRFMVGDVTDIPIIKLHKVKVGGKDRKISCLRDPREPVDKCPLCNSGKNVSSRVFIPLIEYIRNDEDGSIEAVPKIWERPASYLSRLVSLVQDYGNLSDNLFRVVRNGASGDTSTTYSENYCKPEVFSNSKFIKDESFFKDYSVMGRLVYELSYDEASLVASGGVPERFNNVSTKSSTYSSAPKSSYASESSVSGGVSYGSVDSATASPKTPTYSDGDTYGRSAPVVPPIRPSYSTSGDIAPSRPSRRTYY